MSGLHSAPGTVDPALSAAVTRRITAWSVAVAAVLIAMKTGALINFGVEAGAILGKAPTALRHALVGYAHDLGLAFQIADDLLDVEGSAETVGKATGKDQARGKATFVSLLGVDRARSQADMLADQAVAHLEPFGSSADLLRDVARWVVERKS